MVIVTYLCTFQNSRETWSVYQNWAITDSETKLTFMSEGHYIRNGYGFSDHNTLFTW